MEAEAPSVSEEVGVAVMVSVGLGEAEGTCGRYPVAAVSRSRPAASSGSCAKSALALPLGVAGPMRDHCSAAAAAVLALQVRTGGAPAPPPGASAG